MAVTHVLTTYNETLPGTTVTTTAAPNNGETLIAIGVATAASGSSLSINASTNGWTLVTTQSVGSQAILTQVWITEATTADTSFTLTSTNSDNLYLYLMRVSGMPGAILEQAVVEDESTTSTASLAYGSITPIASDTITVFVNAKAGLPGGSGPATPASFTESYAQSNARTHLFHVTGASATYSGTLTWSTAVSSAQNLLMTFVQKVSGTSAKTLSAATSSASGSVGGEVTGTVARTLSDATSSASGGHGPSGTSARTLADATSTAQGIFLVSGTSAQTLGNATSTASGIHGNLFGTANVTLANATSTASGYTQVSGTSASTLANATSSAAGVITYVGAGAATLANATSTAAGQIAVAGYGAATLANATSTGNVSTTDADILLLKILNGEIYVQRSQASHIHFEDDTPLPGPPQITGLAAVTLSAATSTAQGAPWVWGEIDADMTPATCVAVGSAYPAGSSANTLAAATSTAEGSHTVTGTVAVTLGDAGGFATGVHTVTGTVARTLGAAKSAASGIAWVRGTSARTLANATSTANGTAQAPAGAYNALSRTQTSLRHLVGSQGRPATAVKMIQCRQRTGLPFNHQMTFLGDNFPMSAAKQDDIRSLLDFDNNGADLRAVLAFNWSDQGSTRGYGATADPQLSIDRMNAVANGDVDARINAMANYFNTLTDNELRRISFRLCHEVGGFWSWWGPVNNTTGTGAANPWWNGTYGTWNDAKNVEMATAYRDAYRHTVDRFNAILGVRQDYVSWIYNIMGTVGSNTRTATFVNNAWPGDAYVDIVTYDDYADSSETQATVISQFDNTHTFCANFAANHGNKPLGIDEHGPITKLTSNLPATDLAQAVYMAHVAETWQDRLDNGLPCAHILWYETDTQNGHKSRIFCDHTYDNHLRGPAHVAADDTDNNPNTPAANVTINGISWHTHYPLCAQSTYDAYVNGDFVYP